METVCCFEQILEAGSYKTAAVWSHTSYLTKKVQVRCARHPRYWSTAREVRTDSLVMDSYTCTVGSDRESSYDFVIPPPSKNDALIGVKGLLKVYCLGEFNDIYILQDFSIIGGLGPKTLFCLLFQLKNAHFL